MLVCAVERSRRYIFRHLQVLRVVPKILCLLSFVLTSLSSGLIHCGGQDKNQQLQTFYCQPSKQPTETWYILGYVALHKNHYDIMCLPLEPEVARCNSIDELGEGVIYCKIIRVK